MEASDFHFTHVSDFASTTFSSREGKDAFMQWGLEGNLIINKFRVEGSVRSADAMQIIRTFMSNGAVVNTLELNGEFDLTSECVLNELKTSVRSLEFFDRLTESGIVSASGTIAGCFEETYDGISVSDKLKDVLVNPDSENATLFSDDDKQEFVYRLFKMLCVGGSMCQQDENIARYLETTKNLYKEFLVLYKAAGSSEIKSACRVFDLSGTPGVFPSSVNAAQSSLILILNHIEKSIVTIKLSYASFW